MARRHVVPPAAAGSAAAAPVAGKRNEPTGGASVQPRGRQGRAHPAAMVPVGRPLVGSHDGGWIATVSRSDDLLVVNLFSGTRVPVPTQQKLESATECACPNYSTMWRGLLTGLIYVKKVIFSTDPSSTSCILAAMTQLCSVALCRVGSSDGDWTTQGWGTMLTDITFCNGELCGIQRGALFKFGININKDGNPVASPIHRLNIEMNALHALEVTSHPRYIFQPHSKLAIAVEVLPESHDHSTKFFRVFELANDNKMWEEVMSLDDYTLFLDPACSKAVPVSVMDRRGGVDRNCIYYSEQDASLHHHVVCLPKLYIGSCTVYCRKSEDVHHLQRIISRGYHYRRWDAGNGRNCCMWLLPPEF
ncbi:hypothetical protein VPH35_063835 [Triticum aestivum]|uniref:KIB1-4 beta-propeller domain-containing protein n=1 Tax=Aegilops tauschii TaxID=37682 RepID=M8BYH4_AEGTA